MKTSEARSIAVKAQYTKITKKIEEACKEGLECIEYKKGILFDEVLRWLIDDGFFVVRDYNTKTATISWYDDVSNDDGEVRYIFTVDIYEEYEDGDTESFEGNVTIDAGKRVLSYDELVDILQEEFSKVEINGSEEEFEFVVEDEDESSEVIEEEQSAEATVMNEESIDEKYEVVENIQTENGRVLVVKANNNEE